MDSRLTLVDPISVKELPLVTDSKRILIITVDKCGQSSPISVVKLVFGFCAKPVLTVANLGGNCPVWLRNGRCRKLFCLLLWKQAIVIDVDGCVRSFHDRKNSYFSTIDNSVCWCYRTLSKRIGAELAPCIMVLVVVSCNTKNGNLFSGLSLTFIFLLV